MSSQLFHTQDIGMNLQIAEKLNSKECKHNLSHLQQEL